MTSVRLSSPLSAPDSLSGWRLTLYILTTSLLKLNVFACVAALCADAATADGMSVGVGGTLSAASLSVGL